MVRHAECLEYCVYQLSGASDGSVVAGAARSWVLPPPSPLLGALRLVPCNLWNTCSTKCEALQKCGGTAEMRGHCIVACKIVMWSAHACCD